MESAFRTLSKSPVVVESYSLLQAELTPTTHDVEVLASQTAFSTIFF